MRSAFALVLVLAAGCETLGIPPLGDASRALGIEPPDVRIAEVRLAEAPSNPQIAMRLCDELASERGLPGRAVCAAFGRAPTRDDLTFAFEVELDIGNPNRIPLPLAEALVGFRAWPEHDEENLGAVCVSLCEEAAECPAMGADACRSSDPEIRDARDFADAAAGFLRAVVLGEREGGELGVRTVPPREHVRAVLRLELEPDRMMRLVRRLAGDAVSDVRVGQVPELEVPFELEGTVWVRVEALGRLGAGFGPHRDAWHLR